MTIKEADFIGSMNMCDEISNEAYKKIMCNCEVEEKQPSEDCISRQAVLAIAGDSCLDLDSYDDTKEFCDEIKELPPVTPQTRWIPVSERLPNFNDIVLASTDSDYDELRVILTVYSAEEFWFNGKIKAWMPLPEPYKTESEDKE